MINNLIVNNLVKEFGKDYVKIYCKLESKKNKLISEEFKTSNPNEPNEYEYEAKWWEDKYKELTINQL